MGRNHKTQKTKHNPQNQSEKAKTKLLIFCLLFAEQTEKSVVARTRIDETTLRLGEAQNSAMKKNKTLMDRQIFENMPGELPTLPPWRPSPRIASASFHSSLTAHAHTIHISAAHQQRIATVQEPQEQSTLRRFYSRLKVFPQFNARTVERSRRNTYVASGHSRGYQQDTHRGPKGEAVSDPKATQKTQVPTT